MPLFLCVWRLFSITNTFFLFKQINYLQRSTCLSQIQTQLEKIKIKIIAMDKCHHKCEKYVNACHKRTTYIDCYEPIIEPINGQNMWRLSGLPPVQPPIKRRPPGRPNSCPYFYVFDDCFPSLNITLLFATEILVIINI